MRYSTSQLDPLELERRSYESLFDLMEEYRDEHPDATDDEAFEYVCFHRVPEIVSHHIDVEKEKRREQY